MRKEIRKSAKKSSKERTSTSKSASPLRAKGPDIIELAAVANRVREEFNGNEIDLCSLLNAKSGKCSEDCVFCAQSAHYKTEALVYPMMDTNRIVEEAKKAQRKGTGRFLSHHKRPGAKRQEFETF